MNSGNIAFGIKKVISDRGLVQRVVASRSGFTEQQLSDMLNGRKVIRADYLVRIADAIGVSIEDLYAAGKCNS